MYDTPRSDDRINFVTRCVLEMCDSKYTCLVENISAAGALVEINTFSPNYVQLGNTGKLKVLLLSPVTYRCKVARVNNNKIGLKFY